MVDYVPVLVNHRNELIHMIWNFLEVRRYEVSHINWLLAKAAAKLRNVGDRCCIQCPQSVFVKRLYSLDQSNLNTVVKQTVLTAQILLLHSLEQFWVLAFSEGHSLSGGLGPFIGPQANVFNGGSGRSLSNEFGVYRGVAIDKAYRLFSQIFLRDAPLTR